MPRVIFVNRYFFPDLSATSQMLTDLAFHLAQQGWDITVITGRQRYADARASLSPRETIRGVEIVRVATTGFGRTRLIKRALDYLSFYVSAFWALIRLLRKRDIVVAKTDPPLMSVVAAVACWVRGARQINWLQDLFPEVAVVLAPEVLTGMTARIAQRGRDWSLRRAELNVVLGDLMFARVRGVGIASERILKIPNWTDDHVIRPIPHHLNPLRTEWGLNGKFVIAYSGNLGRAHEFRAFMETAILLNGRSDIVFLIIGGGAQLQNVRNFAVAFGLVNVVEQAYQPREQLLFSLGVADLHVVSLKPALEGLIVPSKFYGIAAAQRATAFIGDPDGEIGSLVRRYDCGRCFAVGDAQGLADFTVYLAEQRDECERLGRNGRLALEAEWSQDKAFQRWRNALSRLHT